MKKIEWKKAITDEIQRQAEQPPCVLVSEDREQVLQNVGPEHQVEVEEHFNRLSDLQKEEKWDYVMKSLDTLTRLITEKDVSRFQKPILTMADAADFLDVSKKRFDNIICIERKKQGKTPDFIIDNGIFRRVLKDKLIDWACKSRNKAGRRKSA